VAAPAQLSTGRVQPTEYQVKAAYLLNFTKFIEWPADGRNAPFTICIALPDPFGPVLDQVVEGETVNGRKISVRRLDEDEQAPSCHMLYTGRALPVPTDPGVLTVGEGEEFVKKGGIIGFVVENRRVRFDINQRAAHRAGIALSSKLLSVARTVER
jgi:hypothetical protein